MDVIADKGDAILRTVQEDRPVMFVVARRGPGGGSIKLAVGNGDTACSRATRGCGKHLTSNQ